MAGFETAFTEYEGCWDIFNVFSLVPKNIGINF